MASPYGDSRQIKNQKLNIKNTNQKLKRKRAMLSLSEVKHVARLANLKLSEDEFEKFQKQLSDVVAYIEKLKQLKTKGVEPTSQVTGLENVFREDKVKSSMTQVEALSNTRETYKGFFKVKAIF